MEEVDEVEEVKEMEDLVDLEEVEEVDEVFEKEDQVKVMVGKVNEEEGREYLEEQKFKEEEEKIEVDWEEEEDEYEQELDELEYEQEQLQIEYEKQLEELEYDEKNEEQRDLRLLQNLEYYQEQEVNLEPEEQKNENEEHGGRINLAEEVEFNNEEFEEDKDVDTNENSLKKNEDVKGEVEEEAATLIQAAFRGHKTRNQQLEDNIGKNREAPEKYEIFEQEEDAATLIQAGYRGRQRRKLQLELVEQKEEARVLQSPVVDLIVGKPENVADRDDEAATIIQAGFYAHQIRKKIKPNIFLINNEHNKESKIDQKRFSKSRDEAATTLQTGFIKGPKSRKRQQREEAASKIQEEFQSWMFRKKHGGLDDEQIDGAATTIQASFKGHQTRKKFKTRKIEKGIYKKNYRQEIDLLDPDILSFATDIQAGLSDRNKKKTKINIYISFRAI